VIIVAAPLLFTRSGFGVDFTNYLWIVWVASKSLAQYGHLNYFINTTTIGIFYPWFAFDGGTLYGIAGGASDLVGDHAVVGFIGVTMLAIGGAYGGTLWLARQLGVRRLIAHAPALAVVTSAYYITNLYGRGEWPEFIATSVIPPLIASGVHLARARAWRPLPIAIFVASAVVFTGSHNITLLWGTTVAAGTLIVLWIAQGAPRDLPYRRLGMLCGLGLTSTLVNAWFLLPDVAYGRYLIVGSPPTSSIWPETSEFNTPSVLFDPLRQVPAGSGTPALYVQAPVWFLAWGLVALALLLWRRPIAGALRRALVAMCVVIALLLAMMTIGSFWDYVSFPFNEIQFPYRLGSYLFFAVAGLVLVGVLALQRIADAGGSRLLVRGLRSGLALVCTISLSLCIWQQWVPNTLFTISYKNREDALRSVDVLPRSWYDAGIYRDGHAPTLEVPPGRALLLDPHSVRNGRFDALVNVPPGPEPIRTNIGSGDYITHISGLQRLGRDPLGYTVVRRPNGGSGPVHVVVEAAHGALIKLSQALSIVAICAIALVLLFTGLRTRRARRSTRVALPDVHERAPSETSASAV
jgi:hypothetical protein